MYKFSTGIFTKLKLLYMFAVWESDLAQYSVSTAKKLLLQSEEQKLQLLVYFPHSFEQESVLERRGQRERCDFGVKIRSKVSPNAK